MTRSGASPSSPGGFIVYRRQHWAFDVTPAERVDAIVTERGMVLNPDNDKMRSMMG